MRFEDLEIQRVLAEKSSFFIHGTGVLKLNNENEMEFAGEIIVARNSFNQDIYVKVSSGGREFLMPIQSVNSIKWDQRTIG